MTVIVPFPAGDKTDVQAHLIAKDLTERLNKPVIVDNRPNSSCSIRIMLADKAKPNGHTLLFRIITTFVVEPVLRKTLAYSVAKDFDAITIATTSPAILAVTPAFPARNMDELIDIARKHPGELTYGS